MDDFSHWASDIQAIAQIGLAYTKDIYDKERYEQLMAIASQMLARLSDMSSDEVLGLLIDEVGYATPKLDVRVVILDELGRILLVREEQDGLWSLPGGWADVNQSPKECAIKEVHEETGLQVSIKRLLALWDKLKHSHPPHWPHTYKCFFWGEITGGKISPNHEIIEIDYFRINELPSLSLHRVVPEQILRLIELITKGEKTSFD